MYSVLDYGRMAADPVRMDWRHDTEWNALAPESVHVPVLLLQAELDPLARTDAHARLFTRLGTFDRQWVVIPKGDHAALLEDTAPRMIAAIRASSNGPEARPAHGESTPGPDGPPNQPRAGWSAPCQACARDPTTPSP